MSDRTVGHNGLSRVCAQMAYDMAACSHRADGIWALEPGRKEDSKPGSRSHMAVLVVEDVELWVGEVQNNGFVVGKELEESQKRVPYPLVEEV